MKKCYLCGEPVYTSKPISWGAEAIEGTDPLEFRHYHLACFFKGRRRKLKNNKIMNTLQEETKTTDTPEEVKTEEEPTLPEDPEEKDLT